MYEETGLILPDQDREGYILTGWKYDGAVYAAGNTFVMPAQNVTFEAQWEPARGISGTVVTDEDGQLMPGVIVSLKLGAEVLAETQTDEQGGFSFSNVRSGVYNLVGSYNGIVMTIQADVTASDEKNAVIRMPSGKTNSVVEVSPGTSVLTVGYLETVFTEETDVYTDENKATVAEGGTVEVTLTAEPTQNAETVGQQVREAAGSRVTLGMFIDLTVSKAVYNGAGQDITPEDEKNISDTGIVLVTRLALAPEQQGKSGYTVYRIHGGMVQTLTAEPNDDDEYISLTENGMVLEIHARKYSSYVLAWTEPEEESGGNGGSVHISGGSSGASGGETEVTETENGAITLSPAEPGPGDKVTVTPQPDDGYELGSVTVTDEEGSSIEVVDNGDGTFSYVQPEGDVTITASFRIASGIDCPRDHTCPMYPFGDADRLAWYHDGVHFCLEHGLMVGTGEGVFSPSGDTTRGMLIAMLYRLEGRPEAVGGLPYDDVASDAYYADAVRWGSANGIVQGYGDGTYRPGQPVTREEMAAILFRYAGYRGVADDARSDLDRYTDGGAVSSYAVEAMSWATAKALIEGEPGGALNPAGSTSRDQTATLFMRLCRLYDLL